MPDEEGVLADSPQPDVEQDSSPVEELQAPSQEGAEEQPHGGTQETPPFHEHPRWQEMQREKEELRQQLAQERQQRQEFVQILKQQAAARDQALLGSQQPDLGPWDGLVNHSDPETARYWQQQRKLVGAETQALRQELEVIKQSVEAGKAQLANQTLASFYQQHPEVRNNSVMEDQISNLVRQGYPLEHAYRIVAFDSRPQVKQQVKQAQTASKRQANVASSSGVPDNSGLPKPKRSFVEALEEELAREGLA